MLLCSFHKGRNLTKMGLKGHDTAELFFEDVKLPKSALLGNNWVFNCKRLDYKASLLTLGAH